LATPTKLGAGPIIGGQGDFKYQYMPDLLKPPAGATLVNCHGLVTDKDKNIYLTYQVSLSSNIMSESESLLPERCQDGQKLPYSVEARWHWRRIHEWRWNEAL